MLRLTGRKKILCDEPSVTAANVTKILDDALLTHWGNSRQIDYLYNYYRGKQPILARVKEVRPEICNRIVENRANEIVSFKAGFLCGEPIQYVGTGADKADEVIKLNRMMRLCNKARLDSELAEWMYICGTGYRAAMPNTDYIRGEIVPKLRNRATEFSEDEAPFELYTLDPRSTFVVYHSGLGEKPLMAVKYVVRQDGKVVYSVYTETDYFELTSDVPNVHPAIALQSPRRARGIPIIEYPLNTARLGIFEIVLPILDAINAVQSNRIDGVEQFVQSLMVLVNADIDEEMARAIRDAGLIKLKTYGENKASVDIIAEQLDQTQTQVLVDYMYQTVLNIVGMPNRNGGRSTSDTGMAVIMRDGWESAEARAKSDEMMFAASDIALLKIVLPIVRATVGTTLKVSDIEPKFTRRNYENILSKSQVLTTMLANDKIDPALAFIHCGMFSDPEDAARRSAEHYAEVQASLERELSEVV